jgi:uncharacterized protein Yka (UPF0111/DUF47 family)
MEARSEIMTDKQWEGMLKMMRGVMEKCKNLEEAIEFVDNLLEVRDVGKSKEKTG